MRKCQHRFARTQAVIALLVALWPQGVAPSSGQSAAEPQFRGAGKSPTIPSAPEPTWSRAPVIQAAATTIVADPERLPPPTPVPAIVPEPAAISLLDGQPIDLGTALRLATTTNYDVLAARQIVRQAMANRDRALAQFLPSLIGNGSYAYHNGRIQKSDGNILNINRDSIGIMGGPSFAFQLTDAIFAPLVARQAMRATEAGVQRVTNDTILAVAEAYVALLRARRRLARVDDTLDFLTAETAAPERGKSKGLLPLIKDIVEVGGKDAYTADLYRVQAEVLRRQEERAQILQELRTSNAELARLIRLDSTTPLIPVEDFRKPIPLPCTELLHAELEPLIELALTHRPELAEANAALRAALHRVRAAKVRPLLPTVNASWLAGGFGGGPDRNSNKKYNDPFNGPIDYPISPTGEIGRFGHRSDLLVGLTWQLPNAGVGYSADIREQRALQEIAVIRLMATRDRVLAQLVQAHEQTQRGQERVGLSGKALFDEKGALQGPIFKSIRLNFERIRGAEGRPLEVMDAIRGMNDLVEGYAMAVSDFERAQFRLLIAIGLPEHACLYPNPPAAINPK